MRKLGTTQSSQKCYKLLSLCPLWLKKPLFLIPNLGFPEKTVLLVCFTERDQIIRIISVPLTTKKERQDYEEHTGF